LLPLPQPLPPLRRCGPAVRVPIELDAIDVTAVHPDRAGAAEAAALLNSIVLPRTPTRSPWMRWPFRR